MIAPVVQPKTNSSKQGSRNDDRQRRTAAGVVHVQDNRRRTNDRAAQSTGEDFTTTRTNEERNKMKQIKLSDDDRQKIQRVANQMLIMCDWCNLPEGREYWDEIFTKLNERAYHGTTDGKPWVEPELTDEDAKERPWVRVWDKEFGASHIQRLVYVADGLEYRFSVVNSCGLITSWRYARLATPEEIEAANGNS